MQRIARKLKFPALLLLITIPFCWKLVLPGQYTWLNSPDNAYQVLPWLQAQVVQWHGGHFPLWDPHLWAGAPWIGQVQPGTSNPLNWILFSMPLKDGFIQIPVLHWYWVLIQFLGVLFGYWLCRDLVLSHTASVLGGCAFGLGGFVGTVGWPQLMMSAILLPLILMFFLRVMRGENAVGNAAASGALLGASFLSGHHNVPVFFTLAVAGLWIYYFARIERPFRWNTLAPAAAFSACFGLIASAQVLPALELGKLSLRWMGVSNPLSWDQKVPYPVHEILSLHPTALLGIAIPGFQSGTADFVGLVVLTLGLLGAAANWGERLVRVMAGVTLGGLFFSLGGYSLFHGVLYALIPNLDKARSPSNAEPIFQLGIIVLAAYGLDSFRSAQANEWANRFSIRVLSAAAAFLFGLLIVLITVRPAKGSEYDQLSETALVAAVLAVILLTWNRSRISNRLAGTLLILLLLFELYGVLNYQPFETATTLHKLDQNHDLATFLRQRRDLPRVAVDDNEISYNFGDWFGVDQALGYVPSALKSISDVQSEERFQRLLAHNYFIGRNPARPNQTVAFEGESGLKVFVNPDAFPRARFVHAAISAPDERAVITAVLNPATDLERTVVLPGSAPPLENCEGGDVQVRRYRPTSVVLLTNSPCRAMVIFADAWFPGWKASVDGKPAQIYQAYNIVRGVVVDAGQHEVIMLYRPASVFLGAALAGLGIVLCIALQFHPAKAAPSVSTGTKRIYS